MCTVTYVPTNSGCLLTSSRDEKLARQKALAPAFHQHQQQQLLYPKDAAANGTWIAVTETGTAAVLLNGAFVKHDLQPAYRKSRGLIFLEIVSDESPPTSFELICLDDIEPFTLVIFFNRRLFECRWDGKQKHVFEMDAAARHIWSSATLYTAEMIDERSSWFYDWSAVNPSPTQQDIVSFHKFAGDGNIENSIRMNRSNTMLTVSITSINIIADSACMFYYDLMTNGVFNQRQIQFKNLATT